MSVADNRTLWPGQGLAVFGPDPDVEKKIGLGVDLVDLGSSSQ